MASPRFLPLAIAVSLLPLLPSATHAGTELTGYVATEGRWFTESPALPQQKNGSAASVILEPELYHVTESEADVFTFRPFVRFDPSDPKRTHWDIRQADWLHTGDGWEVRAGASKVFWGVTESNHLVDVINQTDAIEDTDGEDKLGQPMIQAAWFSPKGAFRLFYLPYFRERTFPGIKGRLRAPLPVEPDLAQYESSMNEWHPDLAARYTEVFGDWDIGVAHFWGTSREPRFVPRINGDGATVLAPYYDVIHQTSLDLQYTTGGWLWKLESIRRDGHEGSDPFYGVSGGFEYTLYQLVEDADLGLLMELHRDTRGKDDPATLLDDDLFLGARVTLNDVDDTQLLGGIVIDRNTHARFFNMEFARRFGNRWKLEADMRLFSGLPAYDPNAWMDTEDFFQLRLARYF